MEHTFSSIYVRNNHETVAVAATRGRVVIEADNGLAWVAITLVAGGYTMSGVCTRPDAQAARDAWAIEIADIPGENTVATITGSGGTFDLEGVVAEVERQANTPWLMTAAVYFSHGSERRVLAVCPPDPLPPPGKGGGYHWQSGSGRTLIEVIRDAEAADDWQAHAQGACGGNNPLCPFCD